MFCLLAFWRVYVMLSLHTASKEIRQINNVIMVKLLLYIYVSFIRNFIFLSINLKLSLCKQQMLELMGWKVRKQIFFSSILSGKCDLGTLNCFQKIVRNPH